MASIIRITCTTMRHRDNPYNLRRVLLFGLMSGCFVALMSLVAVACFALAGLVPFRPVWNWIWWVLGAFVISFFLTVSTILVYAYFEDSN